jgi:hypothetical protein
MEKQASLSAFLQMMAKLGPAAARTARHWRHIPKRVTGFGKGFRAKPGTAGRRAQNWVRGAGVGIPAYAAADYAGWTDAIGWPSFLNNATAAPGATQAGVQKPTKMFENWRDHAPKEETTYQRGAYYGNPYTSNPLIPSYEDGHVRDRYRDAREVTRVEQSPGGLAGNERPLDNPDAPRSPYGSVAIRKKHTRPYGPFDSRKIKFKSVPAGRTLKPMPKTKPTPAVKTSAFADWSKLHHIFTNPATRRDLEGAAEHAVDGTVNRATGVVRKAMPVAGALGGTGLGLFGALKGGVKSWPMMLLAGLGGAGLGLLGGLGAKKITKRSMFGVPRLASDPVKYTGGGNTTTASAVGETKNKPKFKVAPDDKGKNVDLSDVTRSTGDSIMGPRSGNSEFLFGKTGALNQHMMKRAGIKYGIAGRAPIQIPPPSREGDGISNDENYSGLETPRANISNTEQVPGWAEEDYDNPERIAPTQGPEGANESLYSMSGGTWDGPQESFDTKKLYPDRKQDGDVLADYERDTQLSPVVKQFWNPNRATDGTDDWRGPSRDPFEVGPDDIVDQPGRPDWRGPSRDPFGPGPGDVVGQPAQPKGPPKNWYDAKPTGNPFAWQNNDAPDEAPPNPNDPRWEAKPEVDQGYVSPFELPDESPYATRRNAEVARSRRAEAQTAREQEMDAAVARGEYDTESPALDGLAPESLAGAPAGPPTGSAATQPADAEEAERMREYQQGQQQPVSRVNPNHTAPLTDLNRNWVPTYPGDKPPLRTEAPQVDRPAARPAADAIAGVRNASRAHAAAGGTPPPNPAASSIPGGTGSAYPGGDAPPPTTVGSHRSIGTPTPGVIAGDGGAGMTVGSNGPASLGPDDFGDQNEQYSAALRPFNDPDSGSFRPGGAETIPGSTGATGATGESGESGARGPRGSKDDPYSLINPRQPAPTQNPYMAKTEPHKPNPYMAKTEPSAAPALRPFNDPDSGSFRPGGAETIPGSTGGAAPAAPEPSSGRPPWATPETPPEAPGLNSERSTGAPKGGFLFDISKPGESVPKPGHKLVGRQMMPSYPQNKARMGSGPQYGSNRNEAIPRQPAGTPLENMPEGSGYRDNTVRTSTGVGSEFSHSYEPRQTPVAQQQQANPGGSSRSVGRLHEGISREQNRLASSNVQGRMQDTINKYKTHLSRTSGAARSRVADKLRRAERRLSDAKAGTSANIRHRQTQQQTTRADHAAIRGNSNKTLDRAFGSQTGGDMRGELTQNTTDRSQVRSNLWANAQDRQGTSAPTNVNMRNVPYAVGRPVGPPRTQQLNRPVPGQAAPGVGNIAGGRRGGGGGGGGVPRNVQAPQHQRPTAAPKPAPFAMNLGGPPAAGQKPGLGTAAHGFETGGSSKQTFSPPSSPFKAASARFEKDAGVEKIVAGLASRAKNILPWLKGLGKASPKPAPKVKDPIKNILFKPKGHIGSRVWHSAPMQPVRGALAGGFMGEGLDQITGLAGYDTDLSSIGAGIGGLSRLRAPNFLRKYITDPKKLQAIYGTDRLRQKVAPAMSIMGKSPLTQVGRSGRTGHLAPTLWENLARHASGGKGSALTRGAKKMRRAFTEGYTWNPFKGPVGGKHNMRTGMQSRIMQMGLGANIIGGLAKSKGEAGAMTVADQYAKSMGFNSIQELFSSPMGQTLRGYGGGGIPGAVRNWWNSLPPDAKMRMGMGAAGIAGGAGLAASGHGGLGAGVGGAGLAAMLSGGGAFGGVPGDPSSILANSDRATQMQMREMMEDPGFLRLPREHQSALMQRLADAMSRDEMASASG